MTIQHESLHYALIEDTTTTASKLSLKELKPSKAKVSKKIKDTIEEAVFLAPVFFGSLEREETLAVNGPSSLFDDPEDFDAW